MVKCQDIVEEWFAKHYRCYGTKLQPLDALSSLPATDETATALL